MCYARNGDSCYFDGYIPSHMFFQCPDTSNLMDWLHNYGSWYFLLWFTSSIWICRHIWIPKSLRMATTEQMYGTPYYSGLFTEQDMALNRRSGNGIMGIPRKYFGISNNDKSKTSDSSSDYSFDLKKNATQADWSVRPQDNIIRINAFATMWHENSEEMCNLIKSFLRMDEDFCARNLARKHFNVEDSNYYEWEAHIIFDDAFEYNADNNERILNVFVKNLIYTIKEQG